MNFSNWSWTVDTEHRFLDNAIDIFAPANTDYFVNPVDGKVIADAPFFYREVEGDFTLRARLSHDFTSTYDACVLLALENDTRWAKACFEYSDFNTNAVVTVMTDGRSDDANGVNIASKEIWMQLSRKEDVFAIHYSEDGKTFTMARLAHLPMASRIKVGLEAQSPRGQGGWRHFKDISLVEKAPEDIRKGL